MSKEQIKKVKSEKKYTRAQAEKALTAGADPTLFEKHSNYHVRARAWVKLGRPLPEGKEAQEKFLANLHIKVEVPTEETGEPATI